jgi:cell division septum initiation protein DivIVA
MTDHDLARADEVLTELMELVETARTVPMSASCMVPRERTLDLLDSLREVLPVEIIESRQIVARREEMLADAEHEAARVRSDARTSADSALADATAEAETLVTAARVKAHELVEEGEREQASLVAAATVHAAAQRDAEELSAAATHDAEQIRVAAETASTKLRADSRAYADQALSDLIATLRRMLGTAENGREALTGHSDPCDGAISPT